MLEFKLVYGQDGYQLAKSTCEAVFMQEQGIGFDYDEIDDAAWHIIGYDAAKPIAAARLFQKGEGVFVIGRMAVLPEYRKQYIGDTLMRVLEDKAVQLKGYMIEVAAQERAIGFYEKEGYEKSGERFTEADLPHQRMIKDLAHPIHKCKGCTK